MFRHLAALSLFAGSWCGCPLMAAQVAATAPVQTPTIRATSRIVVIDVVVSDAKGDPVRNLKAADFTLLEKGQAQAISHFEDHSSLAAADAVKFPAMPRLDPNIFTNYSPVPASGALNVLLLDALNTPMKDQSYVRGQMLKYLKTAHPGQRMAIFGLTSQLRLLQGFTSDPDLLRDALSGKAGGPKASVLMNNAVSGDTVGQETPFSSLEDSLGNDPGSAMVLANLQQFEAEQQSFQKQLQVRYTLDAMNALGHYLSGLPGRKNLIWFSGSFPINILPDGDLSDPFAIMADFSDEFRATTSLLARSQVAVYPIDARGLMVAPMLDASNSGAKYAKNPNAFGKDQAKFSQQTASEHDTMYQMAADTGGKAFVNTNGLAEAVEKAVTAGSNFYTLTYSPADRDWKGEYRKVQVKLAQQGYTLTYRHGYYADDPEKAANKSARRTDAGGSVTPAALGADQAKVAMRAAMQHGGPDPTEILFKVAVNPATGDPEDKTAPGNDPAPRLAGPYERYVIYYAVQPSDFTFSTPSPGKHHIEAEFVALVYDANGAVLNSQSTRIMGDIGEERLNAIRRAGIQVRQEISAPIKTQSFLRIAVHDLVTDHVGAVEIPIATIAKLKPLPVPSAPAQPAVARPAPSLSAPAPATPPK